MTGSGLLTRRPFSSRRDLVVLAIAGAGTVFLAMRDSMTPLIAFAGAFLAALMLVPPIVSYVQKRGWVVLPGGRSLHRHQTPLLGGVAVFLPFLVATLVLGCLGDWKAFGLAAGACVMLACGVIDDVRGVRPSFKIAAQLIAGVCLVVAGFRLPSISVPGLGTLELGMLEIPLLLFWVVVATNAVNLTDGMDGLASSLCLLGCAGSVIVGSNVIPAVVLGGAALGFLRYNLPRATIFLGDAGSLLIGFALAAFALDAPLATNLPIAYGLLAYSIGDVAIAVTRRLLRGKPLFSGDKSHIHHKLHDHLRHPYLALCAAVAFAVTHLVLALTVPGVLSLSISLALWIALAVTLMVIGRVGLVSLLAGRGTFRQIHIARRLSRLMLRTTETDAEVEGVLRQFVDDLGLVSLSVGDIQIRNPKANAAVPVEVDVPLKTRTALWTYVRRDEQRAVDDDRRSVVCDVIRSAEYRLNLLEKRRVDDAVNPPPPVRTNGRQVVTAARSRA